MITDIYNGIFNSGRPISYWFASVILILSFIFFAGSISFVVQASEDNVRPILVGSMGDNDSAKIYYMKTNRRHDCYVIQYKEGYGISCFK